MKYGILLLLLAAPLAARDIKGVSLPEQISLNGKPLVLNGAGMRKKLFVELYVASLYVPAKTGSAADVLQSTNGAVLNLNIVSGLVGPKQLNKAIADGFKANNSPQQLKALEKEIETLKEAFAKSALSSRSVVSFEFGPGAVRALLDGKPLVTLDNPAFRAALLGIWLGENPVDGPLKNSLLTP